MQNEEFIEILKNELAHEHENEIERVLVFYKNGEKLKISTGDKEIQVDKIPLPEEDNSRDYYDNPDHAERQPEAEAETEAETHKSADINDNKKNQVDGGKENVLGYGTQMIQLPTGRRINVIN